MPRVVHYHAHGGHGIAFDCWRQELEAALASEVILPPKQPGWPSERRYTRPWPLRTTSIDKVTCLKCIAELLRILKAKG